MDPFWASPLPVIDQNTTSLDGRIYGLKFGTEVCVTHILFVDDVLTFFGDFDEEGNELKEILNILCLATRMEINYDKSTCFHNGIEELFLLHFHDSLGVDQLDLENGFKYLWFYLKPNGYQRKDSTWMLCKIEARINIWCNRSLIWDGRVILIKAMLIAIPFIGCLLHMSQKELWFNLGNYVLIFYGEKSLG